MNFEKLYDELLNNARETETFYFVDQEIDGRFYRIFSYRLASYTDFLRPCALESRGIMFEIGADQRPYRLACRPMHKFFNLNENPSTIGLDVSLANTALVMDKSDGSLISTFLHNGELRVKSKTSLSSDQVAMAMKVINGDEEFASLLRDYTAMGFTVNMEYVGPDNRIVLGYEKPQLRVLNIRNMEGGFYVFPDALKETSLAPYLVETKTVDENYIEAIKDLQGVEGYVVVLKSGTWFKVKTPWYVALHHTKDSINSNRRLFECIVQETSDDLKALFFDDVVALARIKEYEDKIIPIFDHAVNTVETFFADNKDLDRKSYAIKGQESMVRELFGLAMNLYLGKSNNYKEWAVKHRDYFKIKDDEVVVVEE